jgi:hypothetical protein
MDALAHDAMVLDVSLGGLRIYSDQKLRIGSALNLELHAEEFPPVACTTQIVRIELLGPEAPAVFGVGVRFVHPDPIAIKVLLHVLGRDPSWRP